MTSEDINKTAWEVWAKARKEVMCADQVAILAAALAAERDMDRWLPIETAPKDGTRFLAVEPEDGWLIGVCLWCKTPHVPLYGFHFTDGDPEGWDMCKPTHWQPLKPPSVDPDKAERP